MTAVGSLDSSHWFWTQDLDMPPLYPLFFLTVEDRSSHYGNVLAGFDGLFTSPFQRMCPVLPLPLRAPTPLHLLSNSPPPQRPLWSIQPCLPVPHVIFFSFDTALLPLLLGILDWECMHHLRSIRSDSNAAPRLSKIARWECKKWCLCSVLMFRSMTWQNPSRTNTLRWHVRGKSDKAGKHFQFLKK